MTEYDSIRFLLLTTQFACLFALIRYPRRHFYRITLSYLLVAIPATAAFQSNTPWLREWYTLLAGPATLLRFVAGIEIAHRQTEGFLWWGRLTGGVFLVAAFFAGTGWVQSPHPDTLQRFVELRRLLQIFLAGMFLTLEAFWLSQGGGWYRRVDRIAAVFGVLALNHGTVSFLMGARRFSGEQWATIQPWSWGVDAACYLVLTVLFASAPRSAPCRILSLPNPSA